MMQMKERVYSGQRRESFLWTCWSVFCICLALLVLIAVMNGSVREYMFPFSDTSSDSFIPLCLGMIICALAFKKMAKMRGTSVRITKDSIEVVEWYGRRWSMAIEKPVSVDRRMTVVLFWRIQVELPNPYAYRLKVGENETYLNLNDFSSPSLEAQQITEFLQSVAG